MSKHLGGLFIHDFRLVNCILLLKLLWKLLHSHQDSIWLAYYAKRHGFFSWFDVIQADPSQLSPIWKNIVSSCFRNQSYQKFFVSNCRIRIGNRLTASFWEGNWTTNQPLRSLFPDLYHLCNYKHSSVYQGCNFLFKSTTLQRPLWKCRLRLLSQERCHQLRTWITDTCQPLFLASGLQVNLPQPTFSHTLDLIMWNIGPNKSYSTASLCVGFYQNIPSLSTGF